MMARNSIIEIVRDFPGLHYREAQRLSGLATGAFQYHLRTLEKSGQLVKEQEGGYLRLYPNEITASERKILGYLRQDTIRKILIYFMETPSIRVSELSRRTGLSESTVSYYLKRLCKSSIITVEQDSQRYFRLLDRGITASLLLRYRHSFLDRLVDNFVSLWENRFETDY